MTEVRISGTTYRAAGEPGTPELVQVGKGIQAVYDIETTDQARDLLHAIGGIPSAIQDRVIERDHRRVADALGALLASGIANPPPTDPEAPNGAETAAQSPQGQQIIDPEDPALDEGDLRDELAWAQAEYATLAEALAADRGRAEAAEAEVARFRGLIESIAELTATQQWDHHYANAVAQILTAAGFGGPDAETRYVFTRES